MDVEERQLRICEKADDNAMHYNIKIWTVFSIGVALSLWILYTIWTNDSLEDFVKIAMLVFGYLILIYCSLAIESFGQKKEKYYKIKNEIFSDERISSLPSKGILRYWEVLILSFIFFSYIFSFIYFYISYPFLVGFISAFMSLGYFWVAYNWARGYIEVRNN